MTRLLGPPVWLGVVGRGRCCRWVGPIIVRYRPSPAPRRRRPAGRRSPDNARFDPIAAVTPENGGRHAQADTTPAAGRSAGRAGCLARPARAPAPPPAAIFASGGNQAADQARQTLRAVIAGARSGRTRHSPCPAWAASAAAGLRPCVEWFVGFPHGVRHDTDLARHGNGGSPEAETRHKGQSPHLQC